MVPRAGATMASSGVRHGRAMRRGAKVERALKRATAAQNGALKAMLADLPAAHLQDLVQRLVNPIRVKGGITFVLRILQQVEAEVPLRDFEILEISSESTVSLEV